MRRLFGPRWHRLLVCSQHNGVFLGRRSEAREGDGDREDSHVSPAKTAQHRGVVLPERAAEPILGGVSRRCWLSPKGAGGETGSVADRSTRCCRQRNQHQSVSRGLCFIHPAGILSEI